MDASCKIQGSIHVFRLVNNMCPGKWVHIKSRFIAVLLYLVSRETVPKIFAFFVAWDTLFYCKMNYTSICNLK